MIPVVYFRSSSLKCYLDCPLRFYIDYCLGIKYPSGPKAILGTISHHVLEILGNCRLLQQKQPLEKGWLYQDEESGYQVYFEDIHSIDISALIDCVYNHHLKQIAPSRIPKSSLRKTEAASFNAWIPKKSVITSIENIFSISPRSFDPRNAEIVATELKYDVEVDEEWAKYDFTFRNKRYKGNLRLRGSIDVIVKSEDGLEIWDYKTGVSDDLNTGKKKAYEDYSSDIQLALYYTVARKYLGLDVQGVTIVFINEKTCYTVCFDEDEVMANIRDIFLDMKESNWPDRFDSQFCMRFCPYSKNDFNSITTKPRVRAHEYIWDDEDGVPERKVKKICSQVDSYFKGGYTPLQVMEALCRRDHDISLYKNT